MAGCMSIFRSPCRAVSPITSFPSIWVRAARRSASSQPTAACTYGTSDTVGQDSGLVLMLCVSALLFVSLLAQDTTRLIVDTDAGSDDLMAIAFLLSRKDVH